MSVATATPSMSEIARQAADTRAAAARQVKELHAARYKELMHAGHPLTDAEQRDFTAAVEALCLCPADVASDESAAAEAAAIEIELPGLAAREPKLRADHAEIFRALSAAKEADKAAKAHEYDMAIQSPFRTEQAELEHIARVNARANSISIMAVQSKWASDRLFSVMDKLAANRKRLTELKQNHRVF